MNIALIYANGHYRRYFDYLKELAFDQMTIIQIGRSEIFREFGRVFVILDIANGIEIARQFFDKKAKIENLIICVPDEFNEKTQKTFTGLASKIHIYNQKQK